MNRNVYALNVILAAILFSACNLAASAQSNDIDSPTALTSNVIEGEGDGKAETFYYSFTANKGDVKVTVDAKTDYYSTPLKVTLIDEEGQELVPIYIVAKDTGQRQVATKRFVRDTKVIVRVAMDKDPQVKLLTYRIKLDGAVTVETPPQAVEASATTVDPAAAAPASDPGTTTAEPTTVATGTETPAAKESTKAKVKAKAKKEAKKIIDGLLDN